MPLASSKDWENLFFRCIDTSSLSLQHVKSVPTLITCLHTYLLTAGSGWILRSVGGWYLEDYQTTTNAPRGCWIYFQNQWLIPVIGMAYTKDHTGFNYLLEMPVSLIDGAENLPMHIYAGLVDNLEVRVYPDRHHVARTRYSNMHNKHTTWRWSPFPILFRISRSKEASVCPQTCKPWLEGGGAWSFWPIVSSIFYIYFVLLKN